MPCLFRYKWVKLPRNAIPAANGILTYYLRLCASAAYNAGKIRYCQYENEVEPGMWAGGITGLKSILELKDRNLAFSVMDELKNLGLIEYEYNPDSKYLSYRIRNAVLFQKCENRTAVRCNNKSGYLTVPRSLPSLLAERGCVFREADAWVDLWCHTVSGYNDNVFSFISPCIQFEKDSPALTLEYLARRWNRNTVWVWRFLKKYEDAFCLKKLPGAYGSVIFNLKYPDIKGEEVIADERLQSLCDEIRRHGKASAKSIPDCILFCRLVCRYSRRIIALHCKNRFTFSFIYTYIAQLTCYKYDCKGYIEDESEKERISGRKDYNTKADRHDCSGCRIRPLSEIRQTDPIAGLKDLKYEDVCCPAEERLNPFGWLFGKNRQDAEPENKSFAVCLSF